MPVVLHIEGRNAGQLIGWRRDTQVSSVISGVEDMGPRAYNLAKFRGSLALTDLVLQSFC